MLMEKITYGTLLFRAVSLRLPETRLALWTWVINSATDDQSEGEIHSMQKVLPQ